MDQRADDTDALLHAARQLARISVLEALEPDQPDEIHRALAHLLLVEPLHVGGQQDVLQHSAPGKEDGRLEDDADIAPRTTDRTPAERCHTLARRQQAGQNLEQGGLAASRGADHRNKFTV